MFGPLDALHWAQARHRFLWRGLTTVLLRNDVLDFVRQHSACLRKLAVFAATLCSLPHLIPQRRHQVARDSKSDKRARSNSTPLLLSRATAVSALADEALRRFRFGQKPI
jgi:hypothetical protein